MKFRVLALAATVWLTACGGDNPVQPEPECHALAVDLPMTDTAVALGSTLRLTPTVLENCPVELHWTYDSTLLSLQNGVFTPKAGGRTRLFVNARGKIDSTYLSIVPAGTFAAVGSEWDGELVGGLYVMNTDLTGRRDITEALPELVLRADPAWNPAGTLLAFHNTTDQVLSRERLYVTDLQGNVRRLLSPSTLMEEHSPAFSRDGQWIYFVGNVQAFSAIFRVRVDGTGLEQLTTMQPGVEQYPDPSPDDTRLLFSGSVYDGNLPVVKVLDLRTGAVTSLNVVGNGARWSPDGTRILYERDGDLYVMNADGSGERRIHQPTDDDYYYRNDWSADGKWAIAATELGKVQFIEIATGTVVPLPFGIRYARPAWKR
jgi:Tol biopolymer transport system component